MNKYFCKITGGHKYNTNKVEKSENAHTGRIDIAWKCKKCGHSKIIGVYRFKTLEQQGDKEC